MADADGLTVVTGPVVEAQLHHGEAEILAAVESAYLAHATGATALPHSTFLRFPHDASSRIIALPAYLGGGSGVAGMKWIASFPANLSRGLDRASAVMVLNSLETGRAFAVLEGSVISAKRTAASAALGALALHGRQDVVRAGIIGCGYINFEIVRFLRVVFGTLSELVLCDTQPERAEYFAVRCRELAPHVRTTTVERPAQVFAETALISIATTATTPHLVEPCFSVKGATVLHVSLRDLAPGLLAAADNVVDDADHVCRANTSLHLLEQTTGGRSFIRCTLADVLARRCSARSADDAFVVFSPFGLGVLDLAVAKLVYERAVACGSALQVDRFAPEPWHGHQQPVA